MCRTRAAECFQKRLNGRLMKALERHLSVASVHVLHICRCVEECKKKGSKDSGRGEKSCRWCEAQTLFSLATLLDTPLLQ